MADIIDTGDSIITSGLLDLKGKPRLFDPGVITCLPGAAKNFGMGETEDDIRKNAAMCDAKLVPLISRHVTGDFGLISLDNEKANRDRFERNDMIMSLYMPDDPRTERFAMGDEVPESAIWVLTVKHGDKVVTFVCDQIELNILFKQRIKFPPTKKLKKLFKTLNTNTKTTQHPISSTNHNKILKNLAKITPADHA